jgi:hypothetical protein
VEDLGEGLRDDVLGVHGIRQVPRQPIRRVPVPREQDGEGVDAAIAGLVEQGRVVEDTELEALAD